MNNRPTHIGICACCLRENTALRIGVDDVYPKPVRHGFEAINIHHGSTGGWHTGPCDGSRFLHYGQSADGTRHTHKKLVGMVQAEIKHQKCLDTKPDLAWSWEAKRYERVERTLTPAVVEVERLFLTDERGWGRTTVEVPTYEDHHRWLMAQSNQRLDHYRAERDRFQKAIDDWKLTPAQPMPDKVEIVHRELERTVRNRDNQTVTYMAPKCSWRVSPERARSSKMTSDPSKVTCKRCR